MALKGKSGPAGKKVSAAFQRLDGLRKDTTRPVSFRMDPRLYDRLREYAEMKGLKLSQVVKMWITEKMDREGI